VKGPDDSGSPHDWEKSAGGRPGAEGADDSPLARVLPFPIPEVPLGTWSLEESEVWTCGETTYGAGPGRPAAPDVSGERPTVESANDAPLARRLPLEIPFDGILNCGGDCPYGEPRRLAPVVEIAGRERRPPD